MTLDNKNTLKLNELIHWVKAEILSDETLQKDPIPLFVIDEVTVEVNFVLSGKLEGGFDLQVVTAGSEVSEERVQKAIIRMKPLVPYERIRQRLDEKQLKHFEDRLVKILVKGASTSEQTAPSRE